jgi:probable F420-dependent oxidoreductase
MRVMAVLPQDDWCNTQELARHYEALGVDGLKTSELAYDPFLPLGAAAMVTERAELSTGIAIAFARSPMIVAMMANDLHRNSGGRFCLGLGSQVKGHNERRFSVPWSPPAPRLKEYIEALRAIWRCWEKGEKLDFHGEHYRFDLMTPVFSPKPAGLPMIPVTLAAVGAAMIRLAARTADGVRLHSFCSRKYMLETLLPELEKGWTDSGMARENFEIVGGGYVITGPDDETVAKQFEWVRERLAFYGSTRTYLPVWAAHGEEDLGLKLHEMSKKGQWKEMAKQLSDDHVRHFAAVGKHDEIVAAIKDRYEGVSDTVYVNQVPGIDPKVPADLIQEIKTMDVPFKGFRNRFAE